MKKIAKIIILALLIAGIEPNPGPLTKRSPMQPNLTSSLFKNISNNTPQSSQGKRQRPNSSPDLSSPKLPDQQTTSTESVPWSELTQKLDILTSQTIVNQQEINSRLDHISLKFESMEEKYFDLLSKINEVTPKVNELSEVVQSQHKVIQEMQKKIDELENRSRRENLIFKGLPKENSRETWSECRDKLKAILSNHLNTEEIIIDRAHRIGKEQAIIAKIPNSDHRHKILSIAARLRENNIIVNEDFSVTLRHKRNILLMKRKEIKEMGGYANLKYDKLFTENGIYMVNDNDEIVFKEKQFNKTTPVTKNKKN